MSDESTLLPPVDPSRPTDEMDTGRGVRVESLAQEPDDARSLRRTDSPCVALCSTLYDDTCRGCGRTMTEVANWVIFDDDEKAAVWDRIRALGFPLRR